MGTSAVLGELFVGTGSRSVQNHKVRRQQLIPQLASAQLLQRAIISAILVVQNRAHGIQTQQLGPCSRGRSGVTESGCFSLWMKLLPRPIISAISRIGTLPAARASFFARRQRSA